MTFRGVADLEGVAGCRDGIRTVVDKSIMSELPSRDGELTEWPASREAPAGDREAEALSRKAGLGSPAFSPGREPVLGDLIYLIIGVTMSELNVLESSYQPTLSLIIAEIVSPPSLGVRWIATILRNSPSAQGPSVMDGRPYPTALESSTRPTTSPGEAPGGSIEVVSELMESWAISSGSPVRDGPHALTSAADSKHTCPGSFRSNFWGVAALSLDTSRLTAKEA